MPLTGHKTTGFSLIELMVAIAIIGILASIALPSYQSYIQKSKIRAAQADVVALTLAIENTYQRTLAYPILNNAGLQAIRNQLPSWSPSSKPVDFVFTLTSTATTYDISATPPAGSPLVGCTVTMDQNNIDGLGAANSCKHAVNDRWL